MSAMHPCLRSQRLRVSRDVREQACRNAFLPSIRVSAVHSGQMKMMNAVFTDISEISAIMKTIYDIQSRTFYRKEFTCKSGSERRII